MIFPVFFIIIIVQAFSNGYEMSKEILRFNTFSSVFFFLRYVTSQLSFFSSLLLLSVLSTWLWEKFQKNAL